MPTSSSIGSIARLLLFIVYRGIDSASGSTVALECLFCYRYRRQSRRFHICSADQTTTIMGNNKTSNFFYTERAFNRRKKTKERKREQTTTTLSLIHTYSLSTKPCLIHIVAALRVTTPCCLLPFSPSPEPQPIAPANESINLS